jgi:hypothetical protein
MNKMKSHRLYIFPSFFLSLGSVFSYSASALSYFASAFFSLLPLFSFTLASVFSYSASALPYFASAFLSLSPLLSLTPPLLSLTLPLFSLTLASAFSYSRLYVRFLDILQCHDFAKEKK